jgi:hypothetical protein
LPDRLIHLGLRDMARPYDSGRIGGVRRKRPVIGSRWSKQQEDQSKARANKLYGHRQPH